MNAYEKAVRIKMIEHDMTPSELAYAVNEKTGLYCDSSYISNILKGKRNSRKIIAAINEILEIEVVYK